MEGTQSSGFYPVMRNLRWTLWPGVLRTWPQCLVVPEPGWRACNCMHLEFAWSLKPTPTSGEITGHMGFTFHSSVLTMTFNALFFCRCHFPGGSHGMMFISRMVSLSLPSLT
jgi:hypothetical protein